MPSDSGAEDAVNAAANIAKKQAKKAAMKAIWAAIAPALPFIAIGLVILFIVGVIALVIISYINQGSAGKTVFKPPTPITENIVLAEANNPNAKIQAISLAAEDLIASLDVLNKKLESTGDQANSQKLKDLEAAIFSLTNDSPTNTVTISEIQRRFDELKGILGDKYKNDFVNIQNALDKLNQAIMTTTSPKLVISGKDQYYIRTHQVDERVLEALNYLVTPVAQGGAGFRKIKVRRIKTDYDTENKEFSKEWEFTSDEDRSISPHFSGQAVDIAGIDKVQRSLFKKGYVRSKRIMLAPVDIMVSYQSNTPGKSMPGSSVTSTGFSFGNLSSNQALVDLFSIIGENSGYDFSKYNLEGATLPEIAKTMGLVVLDQEMNIKIDSKDDNSSQEKFLENIGRNYIADQFSLPKEGLKGNNSDEVQTNIGREVVAQRMKLAALSLTGSTSGQLFNSVGKRKIEKSFGLRLGSLDYLPMGGDFTIFVGQVLIEEKLNLEGGAFAGSDLDQVINKINIKGDDRFGSTFTDNPDQVDALLDLPPDTNHPNQSYTANLINRVINVDTYKKAVGDSLIKSVSTNFQAKPALDTQGHYGFLSGCSDVNIGGACLTTGSNLYSKQDEAWDMPYGSIGSVISGAYSAFYDIGVDEVAKRLVDDDAEREMLKKWFTDPDLKTQPLENLRFINATTLGQTDIARLCYKSAGQVCIKTLDQIRNPNHGIVDGLNTQIKLYRRGIENEQKDQENFDPSVLAQLQKGLDSLLEQLKIAGGKEGDTEYKGNEDEWSDIPPDPINSALGLPADGITEIFISDQGDEVFYAVGGAKIDTSDNLYNPNALRDSNAKITFLTEQSDNTTAKITDLQTTRTALLTRKAKGEAGLDTQIKALDDQIKMYNRSLVTWNNQIRLEEANKSEIEASLNNTKRPQKDADMKLNFSKFSDINFDLSSVFKSLGSQKIQSALNLPQGALTSIFDYTQTESAELKYLNSQRETAYQSMQNLVDRKNKGEAGLESQIVLQQRSIANWDKFISQQKQKDAAKPTTNLQTDPTIIGKKQIEEILSLPPGSFGGNNIDELINRLGGNQKAYSYFAKGVNFADIERNLPISEDGAFTFKSFLKNTDVRLNLTGDTTYDLFVGNITPNKYANDVGLATIRTRSVDALGDRLGLNIGGYTITGNDITALLNGDYLAVLLKVGAKSIDENINIPLGTAKAMIDNPGMNCRTTDSATGIEQSCIENLLVANGEANLGKFFGIVGDVTMSNNQQEIFGQEKIEETLDKLHPEPKIPSGWFKGADLTEVAFGIPFIINPKLSEQLLSFQMYNNDGENKLLQKFGFNPSQYSLAGLSKESFAKNSKPYDIVKPIDDAFNLQVGTTAQLFQQKITVQDYKTKIQKAHVKEETGNWIFSQFPPDVKDFLNKRNISADDLRGYYALSKDPTNQKLLRAFISGKESYAVNKTEDDLLLGQYVIEDELDTFKLDWFMGKSIDAIVLGILLGKSNTIVIPDGLKLILSLYQNSPDLNRIKSDLANNPQNAPYLTYVNAAEQEFLQAFGFPKGRYTLDDLKMLINGQVLTAKPSPVTASDKITFQSSQLNCDTMRTLIQTKYTLPLIGFDISLDEILAYYKNSSDQKTYYDTWILDTSNGVPGINDAHTYIRSATSIGPDQPFSGCSLNLSLDQHTSISALDTSANSQHTTLSANTTTFISPSEEVAAITNHIDDIFHIDSGTTEKFFGRKTSPNQYKEAVKKAYTNYRIGDIVIDTLLPDNIKEILNKHDISVDDLKNVINDPDGTFNKVLLNFLPPAETGIVLGLFGDKIPLKGEFTANFAQKQIEETLGLVPGSFSPNTTIAGVMNVNTSSKFASSFRIDFDHTLKDNGVQSFLQTNILKADSTYWKDQYHLIRAQNIDIIFKLNNVPTEQSAEPTRDLLTGKITIKQYIEMVRKYQFSQLDAGQFLTALTMNAANGESSEKKTKYAQYLAGASIGMGLLQNPSSINDPNTRLSILRAFKTVGGIDLDDKAGFSAGTMENLILHPGDSRSILFAQGLRSVAEKNLFGDAEPYKNDLLILFQYYLPESISNPAYFVSVGQGQNGSGFNPNNGGNCTPPASSGYNSSMLPGDKQDFISRHRTLCAYQIIDGVLHDVIKQATTIKDKNGKMLPGGEGIDIPLADIGLLEKGDMGVLTNIGLAYAVNRVKAEQDSDGNAIQIIPKDFYISYADIKAAVNPSASEKSYLKNVAATKYMVGYVAANGGNKPTQSQTIEECTKSSAPGSTMSCVEKDNPNYKPEYDTDIISGETKVRNNAVVNAKKDLEYRYMDAQLMSLAKVNDMSPIPVNFTRIMLTGTDSERANMLLAYGITNLLAQNVLGTLVNKDQQYLLRPLKDHLNQFVSDKNIANLRNYLTSSHVATDPIYSYLDDILSKDIKKLGVSISLPKVGGVGVTEYLLIKGYQLFGGTDIGTTELNKINNFEKTAGKDFAISLASQLLDKKLGLKPGTAQGMYTVYKAYRAVSAANNAFAAAQLASTTAQTAATVAQTTYDNTVKVLDQATKYGSEAAQQAAQQAVDTAKKAVDAAKATVDTAKTTESAAKIKAGVAKGQVMTLVVQLALFAFSEDLLNVDQKLNLPPGSTASIISFGASLAVYEAYYAGTGAAGSSMMAAGVWIAAAFMVYTIVFGFNKVEYQITCPGDYTFRSWCTESNSLYTRWARISTRKLIDDMLKINDRTKQNDLLPTIIGTYRKEDYNYFNGVTPDGKEDLISRYYGGFSMLRGIKGLYQSDYMADFVHIGY